MEPIQNSGQDNLIGGQPPVSPTPEPVAPAVEPAVPAEPVAPIAPEPTTAPIAEPVAPVAPVEPAAPAVPVMGPTTTPVAEPTVPAVEDTSMLSTGADLSHTMRDLNTKSVSRESIMNNKIFDRVEANGDIVIINDLNKRKPRRPRDKMSPTMKKILLTIVGVMTAATAAILIIMAIGNRPPEVGPAAEDPVKLAFNSLAHHIFGDGDSTEDFEFSAKETEFYSASRVGSNLDPLPDKEKLKTKFMNFKNAYIGVDERNAEGLDVMGWFYVEYGTDSLLKYEEIIEKYASSGEEAAKKMIDEKRDSQIADYPQAESYIKKRHELDMQALGMAKIMDNYGCIEGTAVDLYCTFDPSSEDLDTMNRYYSNRSLFFADLGTVRRFTLERFIEIYNDLYNGDNKYDEEADKKLDEEEEPEETYEFDEDELDNPSEEEKPTEEEQPADEPTEEPVDEGLTEE